MTGKRGRQANGNGYVRRVDGAKGVYYEARLRGVYLGRADTRHGAQALIDAARAQESEPKC